MTQTHTNTRKKPRAPARARPAITSPTPNTETQGASFTVDPAVLAPQHDLVDQRPAKNGSISFVSPQGALLNGDQGDSDLLNNPVAEGQTIDPAMTNSRTSGRPPRRKRLESADTHPMDALANRQTITETHTAASSSGRPIGKRQVATDPHLMGALASDQTTNETIPVSVASGRTKSSRDHNVCDAHMTAASASDQTQAGEIPTRNPSGRIKNGKGHTRNVTHSFLAPATDEGVADSRYSDPLVKQIRALWRTRVDWHKEEKSLTLRAKGVCRRFCGVQGKDDKPGLARAAAMFDRIESEALNPGDEAAAIVLGPLLAARAIVAPPRKQADKDLEKLAKQFPVYAWIETVPGVGALLLAEIIGEAGAVGEYRTVAGLWKRMGQAVIDGERQRRKKGEEEALKHGFCPERGAIMFNVGSSLIGCMGLGPRPRVGEPVSQRHNEWSYYQRLFVEQLRKEVEKDPAHARPAKVQAKTGDLVESFSKHAANKARRYVAKRFLRHLWQEWRRAIALMTSKTLSPDATLSASAEPRANTSAKPKRLPPSATLSGHPPEPQAIGSSSPNRKTPAAPLESNSESA